MTPSAFLASAAATLPIQEAIQAASVTGADEIAVFNIKTTWSCLVNSTEHCDLSNHIKRAWDAQSQQPPITIGCLPLNHRSIKQGLKRWSVHTPATDYMLLR